MSDSRGSAAELSELSTISSHFDSIWNLKSHLRAINLRLCALVRFRLNRFGMARKILLDNRLLSFRGPTLDITQLRIIWSGEACSTI
jgi:hypothetical protein